MEDFWDKLLAEVQRVITAIKKRRDDRRREKVKPFIVFWRTPRDDEWTRWN